MNIITLEKIHASCTECGDCLEWTGSTSKAGVPKINVRTGEGKRGRNVFSARRVVWKLAKPTRPLNSRVLITTKCGNPRCLNPEHLVTTDHGKVAAKNGARLEVKLKRSANSGRPRKLTAEKVQQIRESDLPVRKLAAMFGVGPSSINRVKTGQNWKIVGANPFAGLILSLGA